jgi:putative two-component system response regulator
MKEIEKPTILVVDDTPENIEILAGTLKSDYKIKVANNGKTALKIAQKMPMPDLILLDVMMPEMDGYEVCERLKSQPNTAQIPVIFVTAKISPEDEIHGLQVGAVDYITKPINPKIALQRVATHLALNDVKRGLYEKVKEQTYQINRTKVQIVQSLGRAAEYKDNETGMHVLRMASYCYMLAIASGMSEEDADVLKEAAPMHDVGKIGIPDAVLLKNGKLDDEEWAIMRKHVEMGGDILGDTSESELLSMAKVVALTHHEKFDGSGYPNGLVGEDIPLIGRIAAIADVFDALTSERPYKKAWSTDDAFELISNEKGKHFDPMLAQLFLDNREKVLEIKARLAD